MGCGCEILKGCNLSSWKDGVASNCDGEDLREGKFSLGHVKLDMSIRCPNGDAELITGYVSLGFRNEIWIGDIHLRITSNWVVLKP